MSKEKKTIENIDEEPIVEAEVVNDEPIVEETPNEVNDIIIGIVSTDSCYMRKEPYKNSGINLFLRKGDTVIVTPDGDSGNYYLVTAKTKVGYVLKNEITIE